jgi:ABC-type multidrug transport system fused ATPase/permease subunit
MVRSAGVRDGAEPGAGDRQTLGDLVAQATRDISQLVRYEMDLARAELTADVKRAGVAGALFGFAAFMGCLILFALTFALAYGLQSARVLPGTSALYLCFLWAALFIALLAVLIAGVGSLLLRRFSKMEKTRKTVTDDLEMLRRRDGASPAMPKSEPPALPKS